MRYHKHLMLSDILVNKALLLISKKSQAQLVLALPVSLGKILKVNCASATKESTFYPGSVPAGLSYCLPSFYIVLASVDASQARGMQWRKEGRTWQCLGFYQSTGVCRFPSLPGDATKNWDGGNGCEGLHLGSYRSFLGSHTRVAMPRGIWPCLSLPCLCACWDEAATVTQAAPVQSSPLFQSLKETSLSCLQSLGSNPD